MNSDDVNDRKQKLSNIIKKITESQLLKIKEADNACSRQDCNFNTQERDDEMNKSMSLKLLNEKGHFGGPDFKDEGEGPSTELSGALPEHADL